jgi:hypothetical protein
MPPCIVILVINLLTSCGGINRRSVYEGALSQQKANNAGIKLKKKLCQVNAYPEIRNIRQVVIGIWSLIVVT